MTVTAPAFPEQLNEDGLLQSSPDSIATYSGGWIRPLRPRPEDININDIAHALSNQCRFTGHTREFYSVAEHCVLATMLVPDEFKFTCLLHDASEAYLADLARPIKHAPGLGRVYRQAEERLERAIAEHFGTAFPMPPEVKEADNLILAAEIHHLFGEEFSKRWPAPAAGTPVPRCWSPRTARREFRKLFNQLKPGRSSTTKAGRSRA